MEIRPKWAQSFPENCWLSLGMAGGVAGAVGFLTTLLGTTVLREYGLALFCGVPMSMGIIAPLLHGMGAKRNFGGLLAANMLAQIILFCSMFMLGAEGLGCLIMCAPLWFIFALLGTAIVYPIHAALWRGTFGARGFPVAGLLIVLATPIWMGAEKISPPVPEVWPVTTVVEIDAPPEVVWSRVISFPALARPGDWMFKLGIAYPQRARIVGHGVGAVRYCEFSTGAFVEPIRVWQENRLLAFDVVQSPPSMQELSPYTDIHPAHLEGYLISRHGQFELTDLGNGRTRLAGTTWYQNDMFPAAYWRLWSDACIHHIHTMVLTHIKGLSESDVKKEGKASHD
jgi:hypothetical protein